MREVEKMEARCPNAFDDSFVCFAKPAGPQKSKPQDAENDDDHTPY